MFYRFNYFVGRIVIFIIGLSAGLSYAGGNKPLPPSMGGVASNALEPVGIFTNALYSICYILGAAFILGGAVRYKEYRENPTQTPISRPIAIVLFGIVLLAVPIIAKLSEASTAAG